MSHRNTNVARFGHAICKIDVEGITKGSGLVVKLDEAAAADDQVCLTTLDSVISIDALKNKSVVAHFREMKGSGCATFRYHQTTSSNSESEYILLTERVPSNELRTNNIILLPQSQLRYTGLGRFIHKLGLPKSLHRRALPTTDYSVNKNDGAVQQSLSFRSKDETFLCHVVVDSGNQPKPTVSWRSYELFCEDEQKFYLQKQGERLSTKIMERKDFVGDEVPQGAVILNQNEEFVGLLAFCEDGRLHPIWFDNCDRKTSQSPVSDRVEESRSTSKESVAEEFNGKLVDCSSGNDKYSDIVPGNDDNEFSSELRRSEPDYKLQSDKEEGVAGYDSLEEKNPLNSDTSSVSDRVEESRSTSKESVAEELNRKLVDCSSGNSKYLDIVPGNDDNEFSSELRRSELDYKIQSDKEEGVAGYDSLKERNPINSTTPSVSDQIKESLSLPKNQQLKRSMPMEESQIVPGNDDDKFLSELRRSMLDYKLQSDKGYYSHEERSPLNSNTSSANPEEISGNFSEVDGSLRCPANSIQGQYGGISEQEERKCDRQEPVSERSDVSNEYGENLSMSTSRNNSVTRMRSVIASNMNPNPPIRRLYSQQPKIVVNSDSLLNDVVGRHLPVLDELARRLDKSFSHRDAQLCCWKQLASYFRVPESVYDKVKQEDNHSPSKYLFEYLASRRPGLTIQKIKEVLVKIERQDLFDKIASKLKDNDLVGDLIDYTAKDEDVFEEICVQLDIDTISGWYSFGRQLDVPTKDLKKFNLKYNVAEEVFKFIQTAKPETTVDDLKHSFTEEMKREDISELLKGIQGNPKIGALMTQHLAIMEEVMDHLNRMKRSTMNWRYLAQIYGMSESQIFGLEPPCGESPTKKILEYLKGQSPQLTFKKFLRALREIKRNDVIDSLKTFIYEESIDQILREIEAESRLGRPQLAQR